MMRIFVGICIAFLIPTAAAANESFSCGGAAVEFSFSKIDAKDMVHNVQTVISVSREGRSTTLHYDDGVDFIGATCVPNLRSEPTIVFQVYCGGSGCKDLENWGIIDPKTLLVRLVPNDWNRADAEKILGRPLPKIDHMISIDREAEDLGISSD
jgi:hypothetical protein